MYTPERIKRKLIFALHAFLFITIGLIFVIYIGERIAEIKMTSLDLLINFYIIEFTYSIMIFFPTIFFDIFKL